ncbi:unnamed protein product, partial [Menidia menidia]
SLFTFGAGPSSSAIIEVNVPIDSNSRAAPNAFLSHSSGTTSVRGAATTDPPAAESISSREEQTTTAIFDASLYTNETFTAALNVSVSSSLEPTSNSNNSNSNNSNSNNSNSSSAKTPVANTTEKHLVKKFVAAAVRSHFDDCPDTHQHFCFHGTCRFLILEEIPACVCHPGFVGMRCEHADLLAVVATNHRQQAVATVLVLCVVGCVLIMVLCSLLHCWWRQDCHRRSHARHYIEEKHGASFYPSESVV